ncbi:MAG: transglycosylase SLT domain-containing protein [Deltaproteobacteria bacterium]|nr:transglycosylase SLT domain-containing protein [Deltaproteobacteria bacterium]
MIKNFVSRSFSRQKNLSANFRLLTVAVFTIAFVLALNVTSFGQYANEMKFCGEDVPLKRVEVYESVDQELLLLSEAKARVWTTLRRSDRYLPIIERALRDQKVPLDFKYLPMAVTNLDPRFRAGNRRGLWRLTEGEAAAMGLVVNGALDERLDPTASSNAAAAKIASLKQSLGSWTLALAAFLEPNSLSEAMAESGQTGDYFAMFVPETLDKAVSLVLAGKALYSAPEIYGYRLTQPWPILSNARRRVDGQQSLRELAASFNVDYRTFRDMNPHILGEMAPAGAYVNTP